MSTRDDIHAALDTIARRAAETTGGAIDWQVPLTDQGVDSVQLMSLAETLQALQPDLEYADLAEDTSLNAWEELLTGWE